MKNNHSFEVGKLFGKTLNHQVGHILLDQNLDERYPYFKLFSTCLIQFEKRKLLLFSTLKPPVTHEKEIGSVTTCFRFPTCLFLRV